MTVEQADIEKAIRKALGDLHAFAASPPFRRLLDEMDACPAEERHEFVRTVILNDKALTSRGVVPPPGVVLQRSAFADDRPTLFCMTKHLSDGLVWEKVTLTFDNESGDPALRFAAAADPGKPTPTAGLRS